MEQLHLWEGELSTESQGWIRCRLQVTIVLEMLWFPNRALDRTSAILGCDFHQGAYVACLVANDHTRRESGLTAQVSWVRHPLEFGC